MNGDIQPPTIGLMAGEGLGIDRVRAGVLHQIGQYVIAVQGPEHQVAAVNAALVGVLGGFNPVGLRLVDFLDGAEGQGLIKIYDDAYGGQETALRRTRYVVGTPEGYQEQIVIDFEVNPLRDPAGVIVGAVGTGRDSTATVQREESEAAAAAELTRRYRRATDVIEEVQHALLPARLPVLPGVRIAASYVVGGVEQAAGGDWFDVLPHPDGSVAAVVGDVVGHGVAASAVMAQLRAVALERLDAGVDPAQVVTALDRFTRVVPAARSASVCVLVLDRDGRSMTYCAAGHPPPLVVGAGSGSRYLDPSGAPPLDHTFAGERVPQRDQLRQGEVVLLYTDGIIERPGVPATTGAVELAQAAAAAAADDLMPVFSLPSAVDRVTAQTLERLTRITGATDDITLLALQPVQAAADLHLSTDLTRAGIPGVRTRLRQWLGVDRVAENSIQQLDEVLGELLENVVEHAYRGGGGAVTARARLDALGTLELTVRDQGTWVPRPDPVLGRGLGLAIVQELADRLEVHSSPTGTTVVVHMTPWKTSRGSAPSPPQVAPELFDTYTLHHGGRAVMTVRGPVDAANVRELDAQLAVHTVPGAAPLTVDLQQVTVLSSAAVHTLRRRLEHADAAGVQVHLISSPGSVAHYVLTLAAIPNDPAARP